MIARSLRVGHPLPVAIRMVGREMIDPIGTEFSIVSSELAAGLALDQAIKNLEGRVGQEDLPMLVAAIIIQSDTGGNLGEILSVLSNIMRSRVRLRRKVRALTSEGRMSARALSALPFILYFVLTFTAPEYYSIAWQDEMTKFALGGAALWMLVGNLVMMNMVNIKY
jgi:tight adherence protein B